MLSITTDCQPCNTTGWTAQGRITWKIDEGGSFTPVYSDGVRPDPDDEPQIVTCDDCKGLAIDGLSRSRYHNEWSDYGTAYKSPSSLKAAHTKGKATVCKQCSGRGKVVHAPVLRPCHDCDGRGKVLTWDADVDPILPDEVDRCDNASAEFMADWLHTAQVAVVREDRGATWNEHHLGLGSIYGVTDYGARRDWTDQQYADEVREALATRSRPQFIKMIDADTRRFGNTVLITVRNDGHSVKVADVKQNRPMLPPTYTDELLNRPIS